MALHPQWGESNPRSPITIEDTADFNALAAQYHI